jgi:tetratricopeptide (TPR) repeat protein
MKNPGVNLVLRRRARRVPGGGLPAPAALAGALAAAWLALPLAGLRANPAPPALAVREILAATTETATSPAVEITYPLDESVFPPESIPPVFSWRDGQTKVRAWRIVFQFQGPAEARAFTSDRPEWSPAATDWEAIKRDSTERPVRVLVLGVDPAEPKGIRSRGRVTFSTSRDAVGAPLFYREVNLPFIEAVKDPSKIRWRFGPISSPQAPPIVLENMPVCGNCHSFSQDGRLLGMDVDYANSKGSYVLTRTAEQMVLATSDIMTWDDYKREDGELTFGLLSQVSPDGRAVVSTVKDKSVFVPRPDLAFSQLFFPVKGILAVYHRETRTFTTLKGADDPQFVQSNPAWSPDGGVIVFARAKAYQLRSAARSSILLTPEECREFLVDGKSFQFELYRIPYNDGTGGEAEPLAGAAGNGFSNYFPKYSPDGKWIVFCRARNYMLLQPDSELFIIPAGGGEARRLRCNTTRMNSWHSWSPNGHWLVFSSKANSPYTQLWLAHMDAAGNSAPPVVLAQMTAPDRAANIPEFVNLSPDALHKINEQFLNDYSFERAGNEFYRAGDPDGAIRQYLKALAINPANANVQQRLGFLLFNVKHQLPEGLAHSQEAVRLDPKNVFAQSDLGMALFQMGRLDEAAPHLMEALRFRTDSREPRYQPQAIRFNLAQLLLRQGQSAAAATQLEEVVRLDPNHAEAHYLLALALAAQGRLEETLRHYTTAVALKPGTDTSYRLHDLLAQNYALAGQFDQAVRAAEKAVQLAQAAGREDQVRALRERLASYQQGRRP